MRRVKQAEPSPAKGKSAPRGRQRAKRSNPKWRRYLRLSGFGLAATLVLSAAGGLGWLWQDGWFHRKAEAIAQGGVEASLRAGLKVEDVLVAGRSRTEQGAILDALATGKGEPILSFDPYEAQLRLETLPWVASALVERRLPDLIYVKLEERQPLARWQLNGALSVIDTEGFVIPGADAEAFASLPLVVDAGAPAHTAALLEMLRSQPRLHRLVVAAIRVGERRWNLRMANGIDVKLPERNPEEAWERLAGLERRQGLLARDITTIDMRLGDRLIVQVLPQPEPEEGEST